MPDLEERVHDLEVLVGGIVEVLERAAAADIDGVLLTAEIVDRVRALELEIRSTGMILGRN
jgi:hypothetical protein